MSELVHSDDRPDPGEQLAARGWTVLRANATDVAAGWGRTFDPLTQRLNGRADFVTATR